jgi:hypothetical protein
MRRYPRSKITTWFWIAVLGSIDKKKIKNRSLLRTFKHMKKSSNNSSITQSMRWKMKMKMSRTLLL